MLSAGCAKNIKAPEAETVATASPSSTSANALPAPEAAEPQPVLQVKPTEGVLSSGYGKRALKRRAPRMHKGVDLSARRGTAVVASASGTITFAGKKKGYGKVVTIEHENGLTTLYAHLDKLKVTQGAEIDAGEQVGTVGRTGRTTGANLHFEVLLDDKHIDPQEIVDWI